MRKFKKHYLIWIFWVIIIIEIIVLLLINYKTNLRIEEEKAKRLEIESTFQSLSLEAQSVAIFDATLGREIYNKNQNNFLPLASLAKIMTVLVALDKYQLNQVLSVSPISISQEGDNGLLTDEKWKVADLGKLTLIGSSNDGALALTEGDENFIDEMNSKAEELGIENIVFLDATGLDLNPEISGAYSTAREVNKLALYAYKNYPEIFGVTASSEMEFTSESGFTHKILNTDPLIGKIPNILFSKTGMTNLAGGNLSLIYKAKNGHILAFTVLGSSKDGRFKDMENLINALESLE